MPLPPPSDRSTCLVTGASSGIGAEVARRLAHRGRNVTLVARREEKLRDLAAEIEARSGVRARVLAADLTDPASRLALRDAVTDAGQVVDVLVNNAGLTTMGPVARADRDAELNMIRTDVEAVVDLCTLFVAGMVERGAGAILNVASTAAFQPLPGQAGYGASKAFVLSYGQALGAELRGTGVTVTTLCPGPVRTGFAEAAGLTDDEAEKSLPSFMWVAVEDVAEQAIEAVLAGRPLVIPGPVNRVAAAAARVAPRPLLLPILARQHPALRDG